MSELQGNGAPSKYLEANIGDIYTDLDTSDKYECVNIYNIMGHKTNEILYEWELIFDNSESEAPCVSIDATLTMSGYAADAKVTGDRINKLSNGKADKDSIPSVPSSLPNPHKLTFTGAVTEEYDGSAEKTINVPTAGMTAEQLATLNNKITSPQTAEVGQVLSVKAVDDAGKPTEWEVVDMYTEDDINALIDARLAETANVAEEQTE